MRALKGKNRGLTRKTRSNKERERTGISNGSIVKGGGVAGNRLGKSKITNWGKYIDDALQKENRRGNQSKPLKNLI